MGTSVKYYTKKIFAGSLAMSIAKFSTEILGFLLLPIFANYLSPEDFGIISIMTLIGTTLSLIANPGVVSASQRMFYDTDSVEEKKEIIGSGFIFFLIFPLLILAVAIMFGEQITSYVFNEFSFYPYGLAAIFLFIFSQPRRLWSIFLTMKYNVKRLSVLTFFTFLITLIVSLLLVSVFDMGLKGRVIGMFAGPIFLFVFILKDMYAYTKLRFSYRKFKEILILGYPLIFAIWSYSILQMSDRFMIERLTNLADLGVYSIALKISIVPNMLTVGFRQMWSPVFYDNMNRGDYKTISRLMTYFIVGASLVSGLVIIFNNELIVLLLDERYFGAVKLIPWIVLGTLFLSYLPLTNGFIGYSKKFKNNSIIATIAAILNIILNYLLIIKMGVVGAAIATAISYGVYLSLSIRVTLTEFKKVFIIKAGVLSLLFVAFAITLSILLESKTINIYNLLLKFVLVLVFIAALFSFKILKKKELSTVYQSIIRRKK
jgi:O-antigen/teichoic acid export membrane protein